MNKNQKKILKYFKDLPPYEEYNYSKTCETISKDTSLKLEDVMQGCHDLNLKGMLDKNTWETDKPEKNGYSLTPKGRESLDVPWTQVIIIILSGIAAIGAIVGIVSII